MIGMRFKRKRFIDPEELLRFTVAEFLPTAGVFVTGEAQLRAPVDYGQLRASIHYRVGSDHVAIGTAVEYAPDVEYGTKPHVIRVKTAKVLTNGKDFFGKEVQHPGTRAQPFLRPAIDENRGRIINMFRAIMRRFARGMSRGR